MRHKHGVAALSLLLHTEYRAGAASSFISYVPVQRRAAARRAAARRVAARRAGHEGGGLRLEAEAMRSPDRAAFHADPEPLHSVVSQEVATTS